MNRIRLPAWQDSGEPQHSATDPAVLADALRGLRRLAVLTGAGCSTDSGIPDYRDSDGGWKVGAPVMYQDFVSDPAVRCRYWARSMRGWPHFHAARPGPAHTAIAALQRGGVVGTLMTQNVDGLHQAGGSSSVIELHGNLSTAACLGCGSVVPRAALQERLEAHNPAHVGMTGALRPDGDAETGPVSLDGFRVPACECCGGVLKPEVVFFGEAAPRERSERAMRAVQCADALLVVGSSLAVQSGLRLCREAAARATPVFAINLGRTRADGLLRLKLEAPCGGALAFLADALCAPATA